MERARARARALTVIKHLRFIFILYIERIEIADLAFVSTSSKRKKNSEEIALQISS